MAGRTKEKTWRIVAFDMILNIHADTIKLNISKLLRDAEIDPRYYSVLRKAINEVLPSFELNVTPTVTNDGEQETFERMLIELDRGEEETWAHYFKRHPRNR